MSSHDVVVVGAGLAGLAAALRLREKGHEPLVLERSDGPGGRVRTDKTDGFLLDRGFQVLLTAYPQAQRFLDYDALDLRKFDGGALVRVDDRFHRVADPFRNPGDAFSSARAPVGNVRDKMAVVKLRNSLRAIDLDDLFARPETTAIERLTEAGFSSKMIDRFLRPLFTSIALDHSLKFSSRYLEFIFMMLTNGDAAVPAQGMGAIADQMASRLPVGSVRYHADVEEVDHHLVRVDGQSIKASAVIVATDAADATRLTNGEVVDRGSTSVTTWWLAAPGPPLHRPSIVLDGNGTAAINHLAVLSQVNDRCSPDDRALIAASTPAVGVDETDLRRSLREWFGAEVDDWETLRVDAIQHAQPRQDVGIDPDQSVRLTSGLFVAGDHRQHASINGAITSGCRAAEAVTARLCRAN